ncbi:hypothetical protein D3C85_1275950 [compost metagenome]
MAQRDQLVGLLRRHDPGHPGHGENVALGMVASDDQLEGLRLHAHQCLGTGFAAGGGLVGDVDHVGPPLGIEMGQHGACLG